MHLNSRVENIRVRGNELLFCADLRSICADLNIICADLNIVCPDLRTVCADLGAACADLKFFVCAPSDLTKQMIAATPATPLHFSFLLP